MYVYTYLSRDRDRRRSLLRSLDLVLDRLLLSRDLDRRLSLDRDRLRSLDLERLLPLYFDLSRERDLRRDLERDLDLVRDDRAEVPPSIPIKGSTAAETKLCASLT